MPILDTDLQTLPYQLRTAAQVPIGGVPPVIYTAQLIPGAEQELLLTTSGNTVAGQYPAVMWNPLTPRTVLPNTGTVSLSMECTIGGDMNGVNVRETDLLLVLMGADGKTYKYNGSCQYNQGKSSPSSGFQIVDGAGDWVYAGVYQGPLLANVKYALTCKYAFDTVAHTLSVLSIAQNSLPVAVNSPKRVPAEVSTWALGAYVQVQLGSMPNGLPWSLKVGRIELVWQ